MLAKIQSIDRMEELCQILDFLNVSKNDLVRSEKKGCEEIKCL